MSHYARVVFALAMMQVASAAQAQAVATYEQRANLPSVAMTINELEDLLVAIHERTARANQKFARIELSEIASLSDGTSRVSADGSFTKKGFFGQALEIATEASYTLTSKDVPLPISNIRLRFGDKESVLEISGTSPKDVEELTTLCLSDIKRHSVPIGGYVARQSLLTVVFVAWLVGMAWAIVPDFVVTVPRKSRLVRAAIMITAFALFLFLPWTAWWAGARFVRTELNWHQQWAGTIVAVGIVGSIASVAGLGFYLRDRKHAA